MRLCLVNVQCNGPLFRQFRLAHNLCWPVHHNNRFHREKMTRIDHSPKFGFSAIRTNCEWYDSRNICSHGCSRAKRRILHRPTGILLRGKQMKCIQLDYFILSAKILRLAQFKTKLTYCMLWAGKHKRCR